MATPEQQYLQQLTKRQGGSATIGNFRTGADVAVSNASSKAKAIPKTSSPKPSLINQFTTKVSNVASQTFGLAENAVKTGAKFAINTPRYIKEDVTPFFQGVARTVTGDLSRDLSNINKQVDQFDEQTKVYHDLYKSGKMSKENYIKALDEIANQQQDLSKQAQTVASKANRGQFVESTAMTTGDILSFGQLGLAEVGGKQALEAGSKEALSALLSEGSSNLEKLAMRFPNVRALLIRNLENEGKRLASETLPGYIAREGSHLAAGLLLKRPIFYQANIGLAKDSLNHIMEGNYSLGLKDAAWIGIQALEGGPLGAASKGFTWLKNLRGKLVYGKGSFIDELSARIGNGSRSQIADYLTKSKTFPTGQAERPEEVFRIAQETNNRVFGKDINAAVDNFLTSYSGQNLDELTPAQIVKDLANHRDADTLIQQYTKQAVASGKLTQEQAARLVPVRWSADTRNGAVEAIRKAGPDYDAQLQAWRDFAAAKGLDNNRLLMNRIEYEISKNAGGTGDIMKAIQEIDAAATIPKGVDSTLRKKLAKLGYVLAEPQGGRKVNYLELDDTKKLISAAAKNNIDLFDPEVVPQPQVQQISNFFSKAGLSTEAASKEGNKKLAEAVTLRLGGTTVADTILKSTPKGDTVNAGQAILSKLQSYIENKRPSTVGRIVSFGTADKAALTDLRQLTRREIQQALGGGITRQEASQIYKAISQGYIDVPMELRGLGDRGLDYLYKYNPLQKGYSRIQAALRYTYNPFFRTQEAVETRLLSHMTSNNLLWNRSRAELDDAVKMLDDARIFSSSLYGEAAQDQVLGRITANITQGQKRDLAGLALDIASKQGISLEKMIMDHPEQLDDALRVIVQYPTKGILASPLARTLNLVFFPIRYNAKVTLLAAQTLAKQPPSIQKAALHSLFQFSDWLKTDEGLKWQQQYADAIGVLNWVTPINSIEYTLTLLNGGKPDSPATLGILGGLPIGVISQILDSQGIIHLNTPYVNPKTGDVIPTYIPATNKARAATAISDVLGSMFTYPGRTLGLPGKSENVHRLVRQFIETGKGDFKITDQTDRLTPLEQNMVRVLKGDTSQETLDNLYISPAPGQFNGYTIPPTNISGIIEPIKKRTGLPSRKRGKRAKTKAIPIQ